MAPRCESPAAARNRGPILEVLRAWLPEGARVLEVACGTGQHAAFFARALPGVTWQPTDRDDGLFDVVEAWAREEGVAAPCPPRRLDVTADDWPAGPFDAVFAANLIHIAPWEVCRGLLRGAAQGLRPGGALLLYGPFRLDGRHTAPSNEAFDASLRARDPRWGVRDLAEVEALGASHGLVRAERIAMPANNQIVVLRREDPDADYSKAASASPSESPSSRDTTSR